MSDERNNGSEVTQEVEAPAPVEAVEAQTEAKPEAPKETGFENGLGDTSLMDDGEDEKPEEGKAEEPKPEDGAPEVYDAFDAGDGTLYKPEDVQAFAEVAREVGLSQEKAQKIFGVMAPFVREHSMKELAAKNAAWVEASKVDPEFGGASFGENTGIAKAALRQYATPQLRAILNKTGLGNHPEVIRLFYRVGKTMQPDHGVAGNASGPSERRPRYPNSNMVDDE